MDAGPSRLRAHHKTALDPPTLTRLHTQNERDRPTVSARNWTSWRTVVSLSDDCETRALEATGQPASTTDSATCGVSIANRVSGTDVVDS